MSDWLTPADWQALWLSLRLAALSTGILLLISTPLAWWLAHSRGFTARLVNAAVALPLVLPPTVMGFYLLLAFAPDGPLGPLNLAFSFSGLLVGSFAYSLPFVVQPLRDAIASIGHRPGELAATLGAGPLDRFVHITVPLLRPGLSTAAILGFSHTLGEFGVVLMIGGNIPGETQVLSIALYEHVETLELARAHRLAGSLLALSFVLLLLIRGRRFSRTWVQP